MFEGSEALFRGLYCAFFASCLNAEMVPEDISNHGQVDLTIKLEGFVYVIEIKLRRGTVAPDADGAAVAGPNPALAQIQARGYSAKYRD